MENCRLYKIEYLHTLGTPESERLKVTALPSPKRLRAGRSKSFPPDRLPSLFKKSVFFILRHSLLEEGDDHEEGLSYNLLAPTPLSLLCFNKPRPAHWEPTGPLSPRETGLCSEFS